MRDKLGRFIKGNSGYWLGKKRPPETIEKLKIARRKRVISEETKQKLKDWWSNPINRKFMSEIHKGQRSWNKGKKGLMPPAWNKGTKGLMPTPWNKGLKGKGICKSWNKGKKFPQIAGEKCHFWKGGRIKHKAGYILIYMPKHPFANRRYIFEHRLVVEKQIGRYLLPAEPCHHLNKIKNDNKPENLMAFKNQTAHNRFEKKCPINPENIVFDGRKLIDNK